MSHDLGGRHRFVEIREFDSSRDLQDVRSCLIELQDFERRFDPRIPT